MNRKSKIALLTISLILHRKILYSVPSNLLIKSMSSVMTLGDVAFYLPTKTSCSNFAQNSVSTCNMHALRCD